MDKIPSNVVTALALGACFLLVRLYRRSSEFAARTRGRPLPPGPRPLPVIGNLLDVPTGKVIPWKRYRDMCATYGSKLLYLNVLGQSLVIVDDMDTAVELFEKRSAIYSSRLKMHMTTLIGWDWSLAFMPNGQMWRRQRKLLWQEFHPGIVAKYQSAQQAGGHKLIARLVDSPERFTEHVRYTLGSTIIKAVYGLDTVEKGDKYIGAADRATKTIELLGTVTSSLLQYFPVLSHTPTWLPGASFLRHLKEARQWVTEMRLLPWNDAKRQLEEGKIGASMISGLLDELAQIKDSDAAASEEDVAQSAAASAYAAGMDTTYSLISAFFLAMALYPEVQQKARAELDSVVGSDRLPEFADRDALPYVDAIVKEVARWHVSAPLGVPHLSTEDDEYEGLFIPRDSAVMINAWSILHNPDVYPEPEQFRPERFLKDGKLNDDVQDPLAIAFGLGRRICPGKHFAEATAFIYAAFVLHTLIISPPLDDSGREIRVEPRSTLGLITYLEDTRCTIKPRSANTERLIRQYGDSDL